MTRRSKARVPRAEKYSRSQSSVFQHQLLQPPGPAHHPQDLLTDIGGLQQNARVSRTAHLPPRLCHCHSLRHTVMMSTVRAHIRSF